MKYFFVTFSDSGWAIDVVSIEELEDWCVANQRSKELEREIRGGGMWNENVHIEVLCGVKRDVGTSPTLPDEGQGKGKPGNYGP